VNRPALAPTHLSWGRVDRGTVAFGAGVVGICIAVGAGVSLVLPEEPNSKAILTGAFVACALAALGPILILGRGAVREPIVYYSVIAFLDLAGSSLAWLGKPETPVSLARADVTKALLLVAAGFVVLWAGWLATRGRRSTHPRARLSPSELPSRRVTIGLASVGLASLVPLVVTGSFGYVGNFDSGGSLGPWTAWVVATRSALDVALAFAAFRAFGTSDRSRARPDVYLLTVLLILEFGVGLVSGIKIFILTKLLIVVFIYALFHYRMPIKLAFAAVIAMGLTFPIVEQYRMLSLEPGLEVNTSGWSTFGANSISKATTQASAGAASAQLTCENDTRLAFTNLTLPRARARYTASAWVYIPSSWNGGRVFLGGDGTFAGATVVSRTSSHLALRDQWQQITFAFNPPSDLAGLLVVRTEALSTPGLSVYLDDVEVSSESGLSPTAPQSFDGLKANRTKPNAVELALEGVSATMHHPQRSATLALDKMSRRTRQIENVAIILHDTPSVFPYSRGNELPKALATAFIPRVLWPGKPRMDSATTFARRYLKQPTSVRSGTGPSHFGDLYRSFGLPGVILGMGLFGVGLAVLGRWTESGGLRAALIVAFAIAVVTQIEDSLSDLVIVSVHVMAPVLLGALLLPRRRA
jgi:hypothetical protein